MLHMDTTPEYTLSIAGCVRCPPVTNLALCWPSCFNCEDHMTSCFSVVARHFLVSLYHERYHNL